jgi:hypothetical protein
VQIAANIAKLGNGETAAALMLDHVGRSHLDDVRWGCRQEHRRLQPFVV